MARFVSAVSLHNYRENRQTRRKRNLVTARPSGRRVEAPAHRPAPRPTARPAGFHAGRRVDPAIIEEPIPDEEEDLEGWETGEEEAEEETAEDVGGDDTEAALQAMLTVLRPKGAVDVVAHPKGGFLFHLPLKAVPTAEKLAHQVRKQYPQTLIRLLPLNFKQVRVEVRPRITGHATPKHAAKADTFVHRAGAALHDTFAPPWGKPVDLGPNLKVRARKGFRAAVVEVKPGLFVVAEVPQQSVEFGFGPLLLAPALIKTLGRALQRRTQAGPEAETAQRPEFPQLPGPTRRRPKNQLARWLDPDVAEELGCPCEEDS